MTLARLMCVRSHSQQQAQVADFEAIDAAVLEIEKRLKDFDQMKKWTETIQNNSGNMLETLRKVRKSLEKQIDTLHEKTAELKGLVDSQAD